MENNFSIFDLERRKWELAREQGSSPETLRGAPAPEPDEPLQPLAGSGPEAVPELFDSLVQAMGVLAEAVREGQDADPRPLLGALRHVVDATLIDRLYEHASLTCTGSVHAEGAVFIALACMKIGAGLSFSPRKNIHLGLAALLHDIGRCRLPDRLAGAAVGLSPQDKAKLRTLPQVSAQIVSRMGAEFARLADVAAQIDERVDGSGHPAALRGKQISEFAAIIGLVSHIASKREVLPQANPYLQPAAIRQVVNNEKHSFPRRVLKEFLDQISLFPVNVLVRLNNESIGRVMSTYKSQPMRPTIELLYDGLGKRKDTPKLIHLSSFPLLHIVAAVDAEELAGVQDEARTPGGEGA